MFSSNKTVKTITSTLRSTMTQLKQHRKDQIAKASEAQASLILAEKEAADAKHIVDNLEKLLGVAK